MAFLRTSTSLARSCFRLRPRTRALSGWHDGLAPPEAASAAAKPVPMWLPGEGPQPPAGAEKATQLGDAAAASDPHGRATELIHKWGDRFTPGQIMGLVADSVSRLRENGVTSAWCAIRFADMRLASLERVAARTAVSAAAMMAPGLVADDCARDAAAAGAPLDTTPGALFLCGHNAGRSQMSAAFAAHFAGPGFAAYSGGSTPVAEVNPVVVEAMATEGISLADCFPKPWTEEIARSVDVVVTMGCGDQCPIIPSQRRVGWELQDPAGQGIDAVMPVMEETKQEVLKLLEEMEVPILRT